jgi:predicted GTPase
MHQWKKISAESRFPVLLRKKAGEGLRIDVKAGIDFPEDASEYDLIIQCGGCMFNRRYVMSRIEKAKEKHVPMTNYGIAIAYLNGILQDISLPEGE